MSLTLISLETWNEHIARNRRPHIEPNSGPTTLLRISRRLLTPKGLLDEEEERVESKILGGKPTRCRVAPGRPALGVGGGAPRERRNVFLTEGSLLFFSPVPFLLIANKASPPPPPPPPLNMIWELFFVLLQAQKIDGLRLLSSPNKSKRASHR